MRPSSIGYNYGLRLEFFLGLTSYEYIANLWTDQEEQCRLNPCHLYPKVNKNTKTGHSKPLYPTARA